MLNRRPFDPSTTTEYRMKISIYHNPKCTKSRETLKLLEARGIAPVVIEYLKHPPTTSEIENLLALLGITPRELLRTKEEEYKKLGLNDPELPNEAILAALARHPRLMERPIVVAGNKAAIGRPPENVLKILK